MRKLWTTRINAGANALGVSYSQLIGNLIKKGILLNRKVLSEMAIHDPAGFKTVVEALDKEKFNCLLYRDTLSNKSSGVFFENKICLKL